MQQFLCNGKHASTSHLRDEEQNFSLLAISTISLLSNTQNCIPKCLNTKEETENVHTLQFPSQTTTKLVFFNHLTALTSLIS
jgi:hypothetical protein